MSWGLYGVLLGAGLIVLLFSGMPVAFAVGLLAMSSAFFLWQGELGISAVVAQMYSQSTNFLLLAIPLFILMAEIVLFSGVSGEAFSAVRRWFGRMPGGLLSATLALSAAFAATTGSSPANQMVVGEIAIPEMRKHGYDKRLASGAVAAGGTLGILIPPSVPLILYGFLTSTSVGQLFFAGFIPGLLTTVLFILYTFVICKFNPLLGPPVENDEPLLKRILGTWRVWPILVLATVILVSIYFGLATPTEAAALGAAASFGIAALYGRLNWPTLQQALLRTAQTSGMIFWILMAGVSFGYVLTYLGVPQGLSEWTIGLGIQPWVVLTLVTVLLLILGMFLDTGTIILVVLPILYPIIQAMEFDPVWFGIVFVMLCEIALISPPVGFNLFVQKAIVSSETTMGDIYLGVLPFLGILVLVMIMVMMFPQIPLFLPQLMYR